MLDHERRHLGDRPFKCTICGTYYYRPNLLKAHMVSCKRSAEPKMFKNSNSCNNHKKEQLSKPDNVS